MQNCLVDTCIPENRHLEITLPDHFPVGQHKIKLIIEDDAQTLAFTTRLRPAQEIVRRHVPEGISLVDELIAERKKEAAHGGCDS
ncbi:hypothetical protein AGMMS49545_00100 [Betaproteobacteria bacterium]|nr:hypothetical protein AGMMS49545_00100 [Betaproteobacteria bacterium]